MKAQYEQHLANATEEMRAKIAEAVKEGQAMREEILADSRAQAERILSRAQAEIEPRERKGDGGAKIHGGEPGRRRRGQADSERAWTPRSTTSSLSKVIDELGGAAK